MPEYPVVITQTTKRSTEGGSVSDCYSHTVGTTKATSTVIAGGEVLVSGFNRNWRRDVAAGVSATTPFVAKDIEVETTAGFVETRRLCRISLGGGLYEDHWAIESRSGYVNDGFSDVDIPTEPLETIGQVTDARARLLFAKRARDAQGAFRGSTFVAELASTLRGLRNPLRDLRSGLNDYSSAARRRIARAIGRDPRGVRVRDLSDRQRRSAQRALSGTWLEYQFGWAPLVSDIASAAEAVGRFADREEREYVSASSNSKGTPTITFKDSQMSGLFIDTEVHTFSDSTVKYYGAVKINVSTFAGSWAEEAGFRFRDFVPALWEWIPYSFLVDYFSNAGDVIEAACFPRSNLAWCARTYRNLRVRDGTRLTFRKIDHDPYPLPGYTEVTAQFPSAIIIRRKYVSRSEYTGSLVPSFQLEIPGMKNFKRYLNIGALASLRGMRR